MKTETNDKARDADRTRQAILHAAQQIFTEKGFAEAGVRDITARAGVNQSLVSRYFGGKLKLFEAALDNGRANIQVHGGIGMTDEAAPHLCLKRAHLLQFIAPADASLLLG